MPANAFPAVCNSWQGALIDKGRWRRFCVREHVYISRAKSKRYSATGSSALQQSKMIDSMQQ